MPPVMIRARLPVVFATVLLTSCGQQQPAPDEPPEARPEAPSTAPDAPQPPHAAGDVAADTAQPLLTSEGWGELRIGMTRQEVVAAAGEDANPAAVGGPDPEQCDEFRPERAPDGMLVMIERGRLTRITISDGTDVVTDAGNAVGDSAAAVRRAYGPELTSLPHKYVGAPAEYLTVWTRDTPGPDARGLVYEVGADGRVIHIHAGSRSIEYVEGCL